MLLGAVLVDREAQVVVVAAGLVGLEGGQMVLAGVVAWVAHGASRCRPLPVRRAYHLTALCKLSCSRGESARETILHGRCVQTRNKM